jgi:hypothetical protein
MWYNVLFADVSTFQYGGHGQELPQVNGIAARRSLRQEQ